MAVKSEKLRIGTRGSPLALRQAEMVRGALREKHPDLETELVIIRTSGEWHPEQGETLLAETGGKGQFAKELEAALREGQIDCAVHSMKDMETLLPDGLHIPVMLPREDARDVLLSKNGAGLDALPEGSVIGSASVRRQAFLAAYRPDLRFVPLRGNVQTRIDKMSAGQCDATLLAYAGLKRLGLEHIITEILDPGMMLPSAGQGAIGIECHESDDTVLAIISQISCLKTLICVSAERAALEVIDGSCHTPVGAYAILADGQLDLKLKVASMDGKGVWETSVTGPAQGIEQAIALGQKAGRTLLPDLPKGLL